MWCALLSVLHSSDMHAQCEHPYMGATNMCETAPLICLEQLCCGLNMNPPAGSHQGFCGNNTALHNPQFFEFIADSSEVELTIHVLDCSGGQNSLQIAIIDGCPWMTNDQVIECNPGLPEGIYYPLSASGLVPGQSYWIVVDGSAGAQCGYELLDLSGIHLPQISDELSFDSTSISDTIVVPGYAAFTIETGPDIQGATGYYWITGWNGDTLISPNPSFTFDVPCNVPEGEYSICFGGLSGCDTTDQELCLTVYIQEDTLTGPFYKDTATVCPDTFPFPWANMMIMDAGTHVGTFPLPGGCTFDSIWTINTYAQSFVSVCCDSLTCENCTDISVMISGESPWDIHMTSITGSESRPGVTTGENIFTVCPPAGLDVGYSFEVTDSLGQCPVIYSGSNTIFIEYEPHFDIWFQYQNDSICAVVSDAASYQWMDCQSSEVESTDQCRALDGPGCYCVSVITNLGCEAMYCEFIDALQTPQNEYGYQLYPNPTTGKMTMEIQSQVNLPVTWEIYNVVGKKLGHGIITASTSVLDFTTLSASGTYWLKCQSSHGLPVVSKVLIQK